METIILSTRALGNFSDDEFYNFCLDNRDLKFERDAQGQIIIMPNTGGTTGDLNAEITTQLRIWNKSVKSGKTFDSSTAFRLPNSAVRSPDASWIAMERWDALNAKEQKQFPPRCPDFVIELKSESDLLKNLQEKMQEWLSNGCRLAWLIDAQAQQVYIYRQNKPAEIISSFEGSLSGEDILPGFELQLQELKLG